MEKNRIAVYTKKLIFNVNRLLFNFPLLRPYFVPLAPLGNMTRNMTGNMEWHKKIQLISCFAQSYRLTLFSFKYKYNAGHTLNPNPLCALFLPKFRVVDLHLPDSHLPRGCRVLRRRHLLLPRLRRARRPHGHRHGPTRAGKFCSRSFRTTKTTYHLI